jgi:hypothetical protein
MPGSHGGRAGVVPVPSAAGDASGVTLKSSLNQVEITAAS